MNTLQLDLGERSYPIHIGANLLAQADLYKKHLKGSLTAVVTNETVAPLYADRVVKTLESLGQKVKLIVLQMVRYLRHGKSCKRFLMACLKALQIEKPL